MFWSKTIVKTPLLFYFILLIIKPVSAQSDAYFQQDVAYKIAVSLDDKNHYLRGNISIKYTNNSPDSLSYIYLHLWANGYKNQHTAFAKQLLDDDYLGFHFSKIEERGFIDSLQFEIDGKSVAYKENIKTPDIAKLLLETPLLPQQTITITTPFRVKIPGNFSRLAHIKQSYMICQWYPKPAVYDQKGWHPMPYLRYGEFYSEFGTFDVEISLPKNYVVGATGELQTASEKDFLAEKAKSCKISDKETFYLGTADSFPPSDSILKTIRYTAENVHDFAWFADKRYKVQQSKVVLASGKEVMTSVMFTYSEARLWKDALKYVNRSVRFYSDRVGEYPYSQATAVQGIYKGSDMEYPMITVVGRSFLPSVLDQTIAHEIGHNWFYGILGSNERDYPWMDEGLNTYLESRYMDKYYNYALDVKYLSFLHQVTEREDQPINSRTQDLSIPNYWLCAYTKPTLSFRYLQEYLGEAELDRILQKYYQQWSFKHPQPKDLRAVFEQESTKSLTWFFDGLINSTQTIDFAISRHRCCNKDHKAQITIKNKGQINAPIPLSVIDVEDTTGNKPPVIWVENLESGKDTVLNLESFEVSIFRIDNAEKIPEINRNNNEIRNYGIFRKGEPTQIKFLGDFDHPEKRRINIIPMLGFNNYDGLQLGAAIYNLPSPQSHWNYVLMPVFSMAALAPAGMAELKHYSYFGKHRLSQGISFKTFHKRLQRQSEERPYRFAERYYKIKPFWEFKLGKANDKSKERHTFSMSHAFILEEKAQEKRTISPSGTLWEFEGKKLSWRTTHRLKHQYENTKILAPFSLVSVLEYANYESFKDREHYLKLTLEGNFKFIYNSLWGLDLRIFTGGFLWHTDRDFGAMPLRLIANNRNDYHYDDHILGRREYDNIFANQVSLREGGFKAAIEPVIDNGSSNTFIFSIQLKSDIPIKLPFGTPYIKIKPYLDLGYYKNTAPSVRINSFADEIFVSTGLMLDIWDGAAGVYVPLFGTDNIERKMQSFAKGNFINRITFSFNLDRLKIEKLAKKTYAY